MAADRILRCTECGIDFVWTIQEQSDAAAPGRCPMCRLLAPPPGRARGLVKWFSRSKGYGFITPVSGPELFVHKSALAPDRPALCAGQLVEFAVVETARGRQAAAVVVLEEAAAPAI